MNKVFLGVSVGVVSTTTILCVSASRYQATILPHSFLGPVDVGGLTSEEAAKRIRVWWEDEKTQKFQVSVPGFSLNIHPLTPSYLGIRVDDQASVAKLPLLSFTGSAESRIRGDETAETHYDLVFKSDPAPIKRLADYVQKLVGKPHPARALFNGGAIAKTPEVQAAGLDVAATPGVIEKAIVSGGAIELPMTDQPKHVPDEALDAIQEVVSQYTTHFPAYNRPRCANIKLASSRLNGVVLMPGDVMSFNDTVGRRTLRGGYQIAGVYKNGKHDTGVGGGICQVSTTLYNASLLGNLKIKRRSNHSMPVAYVPLGRDATVDYGNLDLAIQNNYATPIAVTSEFHSGSLTFRILGTKDPSLSVKIVTRSGKNDTRTLVIKNVPDPTLAIGHKKIVERGSRQRSILTYRLIYRNGVLEKTEPLGRSFYGGEDRIVAVGTKGSLPGGVTNTLPVTAASLHSSRR
jgi:vancomycin resistance protein YoaR